MVRPDQYQPTDEELQAQLASNPVEIEKSFTFNLDEPEATVGWADDLWTFTSNLKTMKDRTNDFKKMQDD